MAKISANTNDKVYTINKWLGVNECPDGDTHLKMGEASIMRNFKVTNDHSLQIRAGSKNIAGLLQAYTITVSGVVEIVATDLQTPKSTFTAYPAISVSDGGILTLSGTSVTVTYDNISTYTGYYWQNPTTGKIYKLGTCAYVRPSTGTLVTGGSVSIETEESVLSGGVSTLVTYDSIAVSNGKVVLAGSSKTDSGLTKDPAPDIIGRYWDNSPSPSVPYKKGICKITKLGTFGDGYDIFGNFISYVGDDTYNWRFFPVTATSNASDTSVVEIWSGYVNGTEYLVAACNGFLWSLTVNNGVWTKTNLGELDTTNGGVHMFGFDQKLYILDGYLYRVWNGTTLSVVNGYRPLVSISNTPTGGGTLLEQVNKLTGARRVWFSPNGSATTFQLPEKDLYSIDYVKKTSDGTAVAYSSVDLVNGTITFSTAPANSTNSIEIGWTAKNNSFTLVSQMRYSEIYNGATDTRVFLYGNGTNKAYYSGVDYSGKPNPEYFPDLNEIAVDSANTAITAMMKHYDRLLTFKEDGAFITTYGTITLANNTTTSAFYTTPLNRDIGNVAMGQARLVKNNPLTLFGRSVYEWQLSSYASKDERNAKPMSERVSATLATLDLSKAICFDDEFHTEYYVVQNGTAVVYNYTSDAWYIYTNIPATCMISFKGETYYGTSDGYIRHLSRNYTSDNGTNINAYFESGSMDFGANFKRKNSSGIWVGIKPEKYGAINVTVETDRQSSLAEKSVASGFFDFTDLNFTRLSFGINDKPQMSCEKIKAKKFVYYKLIFFSDSATTTATITSTAIGVGFIGNVR